LAQVPRPLKLRRIIVAATHSLRGITRGVLSIRTPMPKPCVVLGEAFPSWLFHTDELSLEIRHVSVQNPVYMGCIHKVCGATVPVWSGPDLSTLVSSWPPNTDVRICLLDGRVTPKLLGSLSSVGVDEVISTQTPRRPCVGWHSVCIRVPHFEVGGVTIRVVPIVRHSRRICPSPVRLEVAVQRDASTVLSHSTLAGIFDHSPSQWWLILSVALISGQKPVLIITDLD
jgi:hypothetical protein